MQLLLLALATALGVLFFSLTAYREHTGALIRSLSRSRHILASPRISDHWKERALSAYAARMLASSLRLLLCLLALCAPFLAIDTALRLSGAAGLGESLVSPGGLLITALVALGAMAALPGRNDRAASPYNARERLLHRLVLSGRAVGETLLDIEEARFSTTGPPPATGEHVFIAGLARSGSTMLLRALHDSDRFASLTYRDMPFVLAPNSWRQLRGSGRRLGLRERAHGDGILVDEDSPEALEEVFWRTLDGRRYIGSEQLCRHAPDAELAARYDRYVRLILRARGRERYLCKNNNNALRLEFLLQQFPAAEFLVPYRLPLEQAESLRRQHRHLSSRQAADPFLRRYMGWLAHHEFGLDKRRMRLLPEPLTHGDTDSLDYWVEEWIQVYERLAELAASHDRVTPVSYELLCQRSAALWPALAARLRIDPYPVPAFTSANRAPTGAIDDGLLDKAGRVYRQLDDLCLRRLAPGDGSAPRP